jgi:hypothetical protein
MWKTFARTTACIAVSATALIAVTRMDATAAARSKTAAPAPETSESKPAPSKASPKPAPAPAPKLTVASLPKSSSAAPTHTTTTATENPFAKSEGGAVTLPDWKGKRLSVVRREARKLGLNVTARDSIGDTVPANDGALYRVRKQLTEAGTEVKPGSDVQVRVRMAPEAAEGY